MDVRKLVGLLTLAALAVLAFHSSPAAACMCMPSHPQTHFCNADYVAIIRVLRKSNQLMPNIIAYKVEVKKSYKMNRDGHKMFKHGRILTPNRDSLCGVKLEIGKLYMVAGKAPHLNLCSYVKEYLKMSVIERRGFSGVYRKGCKCEIKPCYSNSCLDKNPPSTSCNWAPFAKCETEFSACMPSQFRTPEGVIAKCHWRRTPAYKACMADP